MADIDSSNATDAVIPGGPFTLGAGPTPPGYSTEYIVSLHGDPIWQAIWETIKRWDINTPAYGGYCAANGDHVTQIYEAVARRCEICGPGMDK